MRPTQWIRTTAAAAALGLSTPVWAAQQAGHQTGTPQTPPASQRAVAECAQGQPLAMRTIDAANVRLEAARQDNSPRAMRAAVDDLQDALRQLRAQLAACAALQAAAPADPHAGHTPSTPQTPGTPVMPPGSPTPALATATPGAPAAKPADPHAGHTMPAPARPAPPSATKPGAAVAKPGAPAPKPADPHTGHAMPSASAPSKPTASGEAKRDVPKEAIDPVSGMKVDPATAPSTTYKGKVYYFASAQDRLKFIRNPETYLKKEPGRQ